MTQELKRRDHKKKSSKAKEPDTFDSSDPQKLNSFILQCGLFFTNNDNYSDNHAKITFTLSYLQDTTLKFFEPFIINSIDKLDFMFNFSDFIGLLCSEFSPIDPTGEAEDLLDNFRMCDNQKLLKYNVEFQHLAIKTDWDERAL